MEQERVESMRRTFIESAVKVVARVGLDKTTTKLIAQEANYNEAYIYRCFENKEDLLAEALYVEDVNFAEFINDNLPVMREPGLTWEERCFKLWHACWDFIMEERDDCIFYLRYYYSANCQKYAYERHLEFYKRLIDKISFAFKSETNMTMLVHQMFDTMLMFANRVCEGEFENSEENIRVMFYQIYSFVSANALPERVDGMEKTQG